MTAILVVALIFALFAVALALYAFLYQKANKQHFDSKTLEVLAWKLEIERTTKELKDAMIIVNKVHEHRVSDLDPIESRLSVLEVKVNAVSSNMRR